MLLLVADASTAVGQARVIVRLSRRLSLVQARGYTSTFVRRGAATI